MQRFVIDCSKVTYQEAEGVAYLPNGKSEPLDGDFSIRTVVPDTVVARIFEAACYIYQEQSS